MESNMARIDTALKYASLLAEGSGADPNDEIIVAICLDLYLLIFAIIARRPTPPPFAPVMLESDSGMCASIH